MSSVAIVTLRFGEKAYFGLSAELLGHYANRHGYPVIVADGSGLPDDRDRRWGKLPGILSALETHDVVLYLDADCVVVDPSIRVESLLPLLGEAFDLGIACDAKWNLNTGVMLVHRRARDIIETWHDMPRHRPELRHTWPLDELAFNKWILPNFRPRLRVPELHRGSMLDWLGGSFIRHFPNGDEHTKLARMTANAQGYGAQ